MEVRYTNPCHRRASQGQGERPGFVHTTPPGRVALGFGPRLRLTTSSDLQPYSLFEEDSANHPERSLHPFPSALRVDTRLLPAHCRHATPSSKATRSYGKGTDPSTWPSWHLISPPTSSATISSKPPCCSPVGHSSLCTGIQPQPPPPPGLLVQRNLSCYESFQGLESI